MYIYIYISLPSETYLCLSNFSLHFTLFFTGLVPFKTHSGPTPIRLHHQVLRLKKWRPSGSKKKDLKNTKTCVCVSEE